MYIPPLSIWRGLAHLFSTGRSLSSRPWRLWPRSPLHLAVQFTPRPAECPRMRKSRFLGDKRHYLTAPQTPQTHFLGETWPTLDRPRLHVHCSGPGRSCSGWTISDSCLMTVVGCPWLPETRRSHLSKFWQSASCQTPEHDPETSPARILALNPFTVRKGTPNFSEIRLSVMSDWAAARRHPVTFWRFAYLSMTNIEWTVSCWPPLCCRVSKGHAWGYLLPDNQPQGA